MRVRRSIGSYPVCAVFTTSIPQIATAVLLTVVLALGLGWVPSKSAMTDGWSFRELVLPLLTLLLYDVGYLVRMTRAAMAEVMAFPVHSHGGTEGPAVSARHSAGMRCATR